MIDKHILLLLGTAQINFSPLLERPFKNDRLPTDLFPFISVTKSLGVSTSEPSLPTWLLSLCPFTFRSRRLRPRTARTTLRFVRNCSVVALFHIADLFSPSLHFQWLMYWSIYGLLKLLDHVDAILEWVPLFPIIKVGFIVWLWLPLTNGGECAFSFPSCEFHISGSDLTP